MDENQHSRILSFCKMISLLEQHVGNVRLGPIDFKLMKSNFGIIMIIIVDIGTEALELIDLVLDISN